MLKNVLELLKDQLNVYLKAKLGLEPMDPDKVVFVDGEDMESTGFPLNMVSILLINIEEERVLQPPDPYRRSLPNGTYQQIQPELRLNLYVLCVARSKHYEEALLHLSLVIQYFQHHRVLDHENTPDLGEDIEKLILELITLPFSEQNEVWNALRTTYQPSVLYKVKMVVFRDEEAVDVTAIDEVTLRISP